MLETLTILVRLEDGSTAGTIGIWVDGIESSKGLGDDLNE